MMNLTAVETVSEQASLTVDRQHDDATTWSVTLDGPTASTGPDGADPAILRMTVASVRAVRGFTSSWGLEFEPQELPVDERVEWQVTSGRSSNGALPWLLFETAAGALVVTLHWSGNWRFVLEPGTGASVLTVGLHPDGQQVRLEAGEQHRWPAVSAASGDTPAAATANLVRLLAEQVPASGAGLLTEWNHWWPYEDVEIDEDTFLANAAVAADLGLEVAVLDAGWFGRSEVGSDWVAERGDWHLVNSVRFPHGLAWLADRTRALGIDFGIWIEAEAVGPGAGIGRDRPGLLALGDDGSSLGYVCLGSPAGRAHVRGEVARLIETTSARWIKWDFNLDPGSGCRRGDHGHRVDDGLLQHYRGLYEVLDSLRTSFPDTVLEACSSGGLRIDAGLAAHVDGFFLSDPDWTEHHLTCLWGAAQLLPPRQLLHWPQSEWRGEHRFQKVDYSGSLITAAAFDTKIRAAMLHRFGLSVRLTEMRADLRERLRHHLEVYGREVRPLLETGVLHPLTPPPLREEKGHRQPAFQLTSGADHLVAAFRLPPAWAWEPVRPGLLDDGADYRVTADDGADLGTWPGADLMRDGIVPAPGVSSVLWTLRRQG